MTNQKQEFKTKTLQKDARFLMYLQVMGFTIKKCFALNVITDSL